MATSQKAAQTSPQSILIAISGLMVGATIAFVAASLVHFGIVISLGPVTIDDPFQGAAIPEAVIAVILGIGAASVIVRWPAAWKVALATTLFALVATIYGLTVTVNSPRTGDIIYLTSRSSWYLVVIATLLFLPVGRRSLSG